MKSRRSPCPTYQHSISSDPSSHAATASSTNRARSPSSSSAASATSTSSVSSVLQSMPTSKMPLRTPTNHPSPGYQGYFDPYTTPQQHQHQQHQQHQPPQSTTQIAAAQAAVQATATAKKRTQTAPSPKSPPSSGSISVAGAAANAVMPRSMLEKHFESASNISANSSTATITTRDMVNATSAAAPATATASGSTSTIVLPQQTSPSATKKESSSRMNKLFSSRIVGAQSSLHDLKHSAKPPPSPNKISHSMISNPIPRITGSERKGSFSNSINPSSSTVTLLGAATVSAMGSGVGADVFNYAPPQAPYASSIYSSSPPNAVSSGSGGGKEHSSSRTHNFLRVRKDTNQSSSSSIYSLIPSSPSSSVFTHQSHSKSSSSKSSTMVGEDGTLEKFSHKKDTGKLDINDPNYLGSPDDWPFVKRCIAGLFEGEPLRPTVEDLNRLVLANIRRCQVNHTPLRVLLGEVYDILGAGMLSLDPTLPGLVDDRLLVVRLVEIWGFVWSSVLPYWEAVFLPLQIEFRRAGTGQGEWAEAVMAAMAGGEGGGSGSGGAAGNGGRELSRVLDTRRMALVSFRDNVVLPLHGRLRIIFSHVQLDFSSDLPNVTENVARVLQCISILASILSGDDAQMKVDELAKTLKHNWLSRGRAGRNRRGFVPQKTKIVGVI